MLKIIVKAKTKPDTSIKTSFIAGPRFEKI